MKVAKMLEIGEPLYYYYSGPLSQRFWDRINKLKKKHGELYKLGCVLQNLESYTIDKLLEAEQGEKG